MPNCLGVYVEKNLIKYAKVSRDKASSLFDVKAYGVKFYDNLEQTVKDIIRETNSSSDDLCMNITRENYVEFDVFNKLKPKDIKELLKTEFESYCAEKGLPASVLEMRYALVRNTNKADSYKAICISANKAELSNLGQMFETEKLTSLASMPMSISNILKNKGLGEQVAIVNIEDETTVTVITKGEVSKIAVIPIGMEDILSRLADKFNSYAKAYEACKGITLSFDGSYSLEDDQQQVMELLLPAMYDLRERVKKAIAEYGAEIRKIYLTGTGIVINNLDLYFGEVFEAQVCEILRPFFISKEASNLKDVIEVNSATALAMNGLGFNDKELDFMQGLQGSLGNVNLKRTWDRFLKSDGIQKIQTFAKGLTDKSPDKPSIKEMFQKTFAKKDKGENTSGNRPKIEFDENVGSGTIINAEPEEEKTHFSGLDTFDAWLIRTAISLLVIFVAYVGLACYTEDVIQAKIEEADQNIATAQKQIENVDTDRNYIVTQTTEYQTKTNKLTRILDQIKAKTERSFDVPNFMSQLMFIIPEDVRVTSVVVNSNREVSVEATSGKYAQLGYFVSRLKLENALKYVDMEVISMDNDIKIRVNGVLP